MENWRLIDLGYAEPYMAQTFYEAVAEALNRGFSMNTLILVQPSSPYVCLGYHQVLEKEIDVNYCKERGLPIIRRTQGGGATYLDSNQIFYQVIVDEKSETVPKTVNDFFKKLLEVTVYVYRKLGLNAEFKPINDVMVQGRKISGNGASKTGKAMILVGNIILDLDYGSMAKVLKVPSEKFRDKMAKSIKQWVTSLKRELGYVPSVKEIKKHIVEGYEKILNIKLNPSKPSGEELKIWREEIKPRHMSEEWLHLPLFTHKKILSDRAVKIADGVKVVEVDYKAKKLIRVTAEVIGDKIIDLMITGDFFMMSPNGVEKLEKSLKGASLKEGELRKKITETFRKETIQAPGLEPEDLVNAIMKIKKYTVKYPPDIYPFTHPERSNSNNERTR